MPPVKTVINDIILALYKHYLKTGIRILNADQIYPIIISNVTIAEGAIAGYLKRLKLMGFLDGYFTITDLLLLKGKELLEELQKSLEKPTVQSTIDKTTGLSKH